MSLPILLALAGTALMAIAIFVPIRSSLLERAAVERRTVAPQWPELVEPSATACDVPARLDLVDALASLRSPWAMDVLLKASGQETDPDVRAAITSALDA